jgi:putative phosphoserine phosphatase / 1-acylglycerol-3-phosphate O-acyltransferase
LRSGAALTTIGGTTGAAIFDLDRTLIAGPSGPVFGRHLRNVGLGTREIAGLDAFYRVYELAGENLLSMQAARLAVRGSAGWATSDVGVAAEAAATELMTIVQPYAPGVIDEHKKAGRRLVLATTSPKPLVEPFAKALGFDDVIATQWLAENGRYTGRIDGRFIWGRAKLEAIRDWANDNGITLAESYGYSDSYYDSPMLDAVGHPVAVNPDARLAALASLRRWPIRHFDAPEGVAKIAGQELQTWFRPMQQANLVPNARFDIAGTERIPKQGAAIIVFNHRSYFDSVAVGLTLAKADRPFRFLGKKEVFDAPLIGVFARLSGGIRVERGTGSDEPLDRAIDALKAGEAVSLAPQGTIPRGPAFFEPELKGRWGAARLAHATHAPVIPVGLWGTEKVWPRNARLPSMNPLSRPLVTVRVGSQVALGYDDLEADTKRIMAALVDLLPEEARQRHDPTPEELARTYPPGYRGDPTRENERRPGTDTNTA